MEKCNYNLYGCYSCCYKFKVTDKENWDLTRCPRCGEETVACIHKALKIMNVEGCKNKAGA